MRAPHCVVRAVFTSLILSLCAMGQGPAYKPGQTITLVITFQGQDAAKIKSAAWIADAPDPSASQPNFPHQIFTSTSKSGGAPNSFEVSFTVPNNQASGDYRLNEIRANTSSPDLTLYYHSPADFPARTLRIENPQTFTKPTIKDVHP